MSKIGVWLPATFSQRQAKAVLKYLDQGRHTLSRAEWREALTGFDLLADALANTSQGYERFAALYESQIELPLADRYIADLLTSTQVATQGITLWAQYARLITAMWQEAGWPSRLGAESRLLLAYWLYWWESFATGYAFEVTIFRDLQAAKIPFTPHDIRSRDGRRSAYDLEVLGLHGDIKNSLYFLQSGRRVGLRHDFYISRFRDQASERVIIVLIQPAAWEQINGDAEPTTWAVVKRNMPPVASVQHQGRKVILVDYETWKARVLRRQTR
jgi:hypothetical protein